ncbi:hypothetical protein [Sphingomonas koreensis]
MQAARDIYNLLRWRLIALRYLGKVSSYFAAPSVPRSRGKAIDQSSPVAREGFGPGPSIDAGTLDEIRAIYAPRAEKVVPTQAGHPFENLFRGEDITPDNPVLRFALSPEVLDAADAYFGGRFRYDSVQVLYSFPTPGGLRESQMWHRDYGDNKSFHCVAYVNDVLEPEDGPFVFVDRHDTLRIGKSPFIRRISDDRFRKELGDGELRSFYGHAGESVFVDPAACYHYGSRCVRPRTAIFATFNTDRPYVPAVSTLRANRDRLLAAARAIRPDLDADYLARILDV